MQKSKCKMNEGQLLVEAMVAMGLVLFGILGVMGLLSRSLSLNRVVSDQFTGNSLAAEGIEIVKNIIDSNVIQSRPWNSGFSNGDFELDYKSTSLTPYGDYFLLYDPGTGFYNYVFGNRTNFKRLVRINLIGPDEIQVNSITRWTTLGGGTFETNLEDHFLNWRL